MIHDCTGGRRGSNALTGVSLNRMCIKRPYGKVFRFLEYIQVKEEKKDVHVRTIILTDFSVYANILCKLHDLFEKFLLLPTFTIEKKREKKVEC